MKNTKKVKISIFKKLYEFKVKFMYIFNKHEKVYWSDEKCEKHNTMAGMFRPWDCMYCESKSQIFPYTPLNPMPKVLKPKKQNESKELDDLNNRVKLFPDGSHMLIYLNNELGFGDDTYSIESENKIGYWVESFDKLEQAEEFIKINKWKYERKTDFKDTRSPELWD